MHQRKFRHLGYIFVLLDCQRSTSSVLLHLNDIGKERKSSHKSSLSIFKAQAYCTFSSCSVTGILQVRSCDVSKDGVIVQVELFGSICHTFGETHARRMSLHQKRSL